MKKCITGVNEKMDQICMIDGCYELAEWVLYYTKSKVNTWYYCEYHMSVHLCKAKHKLVEDDNFVGMTRIGKTNTVLQQLVKQDTREKLDSVMDSVADVISRVFSSRKKQGGSDA